MDENKIIRYCTILLIYDDNHSKIFVSEKNKYYREYGDNRSIHVNILNEFKDIKKSHEINVIDLSDNHYDIYKSDIKKHCIILLIPVEYLFLKKICIILDMIMMIVMKQCIIRF